MHGRKRSEYKAHQRDPKVAAALASKAEQWYRLRNDLLQRQAHNDTSESTLVLLERVLTVNPDPMSLWNHRREILVVKTSAIDIQKELALTQTALENNPKAYGAWFHRKWVVARNGDAVLWKDELLLTEKFLKRDERNFHCWNYRRFLVGCLLGYGDGSWPDDDRNVVLMGAQIVAKPSRKQAVSQAEQKAILQAEWDFTKAKIGDNFSNFSAFHYRSKLLPMMLEGDDGSSMLDSELELVENAIFTEPDDQTPWWYQRFLLDWSGGKSDRWKQHLELLIELSEESSSKWVCLGRLQVLERVGSGHDEQKVLLQRLIEMDGDRKARYQAMLQKLDETGKS